MAIKGLNLSKIDKIELSELKGKDEDFVITKSIKFNNKEYILLKYLKSINEKFGTYVKQLIEEDMHRKLSNKDTEVNVNIDEDKINKIIEEKISAILESKMSKTKLSNQDNEEISVEEDTKIKHPKKKNDLTEDDVDLYLK